MSFVPGVPTWVLLAVSVLNLGLATIAVRRREVRGAIPFAAILVCVSLYALGNAVRAGSTTLATYRIGSLINYVGFLGLPPTQLWFVLGYSGRDSLLDRRFAALLLVEPLVVFAVVLTAPAHDLMWTLDGFTRAAPLAIADRTNGPVFWLNLAYTYGMILASYFLLALVGIRRHRRYRVQVGLMLIGGLVPLVSSLLLVFGFAPLDALDLWMLDVAPRGSADPTSFAFTVSGIVFVIALFRFDLLDLMPVARHTLVDEITDPIFVVDLDGRLVDVNPAATDLLDAEEAAIGRPASEVVPSYGSVADDGSGSGSDVVVETDDGERYFDSSRTTLTDRAGSAVGSLLIYRDVTDRHIVEERFQRLIERSSDLVTVLDEDGTITYVSPSVEKVLGYEPEELIGVNLVEHVHPDDREDILAELSEHVDDYSYAGSHAARILDAAGDWRIMEARAANLLDDPYVEGIVLNSRDVTERRRRERRLEHQNERLDRFAGIVAHDLRNPLNVAIGRADLLEASIDDEHAESVENVSHQLERMEAIIEDALTLARSGETITETTEIRLETVARDAWESVDTGEGIPEDEREKVLEQGYTTNQEGTGFGLAIVEDIVRAHGWRLSVAESDEGGARFEVECYETPVEKQPGAV
ncbi:histidine kinase N-terminal 7TM domain-containing protein [Halorussus marinus]|uniref:histidine kinase N-terminal 7TM domain-containing protein n=1 Tax=Halorussus marinus TaxID=2505976 RepID=UPI0010926D4A|nr:histidine kinase N-terminal 7TM domain-containing protein [Halorussus marinus]